LPIKQKRRDHYGRVFVSFFIVLCFYLQQTDILSNKRPFRFGIKIKIKVESMCRFHGGHINRSEDMRQIKSSSIFTFIIFANHVISC